MNPSQDREAWVERAVALLDDSTRALDAATLSRLHRAREAALAQTASRRRRVKVGIAGALAAAAALALAIGLHHRRTATESTPAPASAALEAGDLDLVGSDDDALDLYENLDFYAWLETRNGSNG